jgi:hypothetical protein
MGETGRFMTQKPSRRAARPEKPSRVYPGRVLPPKGGGSIQGVAPFFLSQTGGGEFPDMIPGVFDEVRACGNRDNTPGGQDLRRSKNMAPPKPPARPAPSLF